MQNAKITGIASYVPDYVLTNDELSHMVDTNDEWIITRVGIKGRRNGIFRFGCKSSSRIVEKNRSKAQ